MRTQCLSLHAGYRCHHSGACCSDVWAVPVEPRVVEFVAREGVQTIAGGTAFVSARNANFSGAAMVAAHHNGACVFFDAANGRLCAIHRHAGVEALPSSCRHFPRIYRRDAEGAALSLSHFCPTAAAMLLKNVPLAIVDALPPLALDEPIEGLDARDALPPLLRPDLLMDVAAYAAWEEHGIAVFARDDLTHLDALAILSAATDTLRRWRPGDGALTDAVRHAIAEASNISAPPGDNGRDDERLALVEAALPEGHPRLARATVGSHEWMRAFDAPLRRYLAARLFANWIAYRGRGLRTIIEWLRICLAVLRNEVARQAKASEQDLDESAFIEAVRETDRLMLHVVESLQLTRRLHNFE